MRIGIIGAMEEEVKEIKQRLEDLQSWTRGGIIFHQGNIENHEIILIQSGIGKVQSAITATLLINHFEVSAILNVGSAGAVDPTLGIGDIVVANQTAYFDVDVTGFGYERGQLPSQPLYFNASKYLLVTMQQTIVELGTEAKTGLIVSGDSFINSTQKIKNIKNYFPKALAVEMEGAAVAQVAHQFNKGYLVVRVISDTADGHAVRKFDNFIKEAGKKSAQIVLKFLEIIK